jgi:capsular exopolysaccharide synthesis family protein
MPTPTLHQLRPARHPGAAPAAATVPGIDGPEAAVVGSWTAVAEPQAEPGPELRVLRNPFASAAEQFRALRSELLLRMGTPVPAHGQVLAVVGAERGVGRSFVAANLAASMAQRGSHVLLVDADLRRPRLHRFFGLRAADGLAAMLSGGEAGRCVRPVAALPALHLLPAGAPPAHPLELLERPELAFVLRELRQRYTHIVLDTAAACESPDAALVAAHADAALLVVQRHRSATADLRRLQQQLHLAGTAVVGAVFNRR